MGDKITSRHGQKVRFPCGFHCAPYSSCIGTVQGICAKLVDYEDMPYDSKGRVPDMLMNGHGFPTRMTVGQWYEMHMTTQGLRMGTGVDGTPFRIQVQPLQNIEDDSLVQFRCGKTGRPYRAKHFAGYCAMMVLQQQVCKKLHARQLGPCQPLTLSLIHI